MLQHRKLMSTKGPDNNPFGIRLGTELWPAAMYCPCQHERTVRLQTARRRVLKLHLDSELHLTCVLTYVPTAGRKDTNLRNFVMRNQQEAQIQSHLLSPVGWCHTWIIPWGFRLPASMAAWKLQNACTYICDSAYQCSLTRSAVCMILQRQGNR